MGSVVISMVLAMLAFVVVAWMQNRRHEEIMASLHRAHLREYKKLLNQWIQTEHEMEQMALNRNRKN